MELWGGHECTVNRVGDGYRDQTRLTGHQDRIEDLARFADLGIKKLRYPVLWERVAPHAPDDRDWRWSDERLAEIERLGMEPIVGLLHHGSGPAYTSLVSDDFVALFAAQAAATAERYPHLTYWTPVNEPLTTARFSALYGFWYPHARNEALFWRALLNQIDATRAAMRAIRNVNPSAQLIQTEDLGKYYSTPELASTAVHMNHRRWMSWDLLTGRVVPGHALWDHLEHYGLADRLRAIADDVSLPDIIGVNYYPTSERFLDHRLDAYPYPPPEEGYHDLTAARVMQPPPPGLSALLRQVWERYRLPLAITESHLGCTRDEQLRWLWQSWQTCVELVDEGVDVRAFTAWALLGNVDWNSLITVENGHYEAGAFDVRGGEPRSTAVARLLAALGSGEYQAQDLPSIVEGDGWWHRDMRLEHPPFAWSEPAPRTPRLCPRPIVITGATGTLGQALARECTVRGLSFLLTDRASLSITEAAKIDAYLDEHRPWAVINAAGYVRVDDAEADADNCFAANSEGAAVLAAACASRDIHCTIFSSDLVFDGVQQDAPYTERDAPSPLNVYGESKLRAETLVAECNSDALTIRTAAFFSPRDPHNFAMAVERTLRDGQTFFACSDSVVSPTFVPDLVSACLDLVVDRESGVWHLANEGAVSWLEFGQMVADALELDTAQVQPATAEQLGWRAKRPRYAALRSERGAALSPLDNAIMRHAEHRRSAGAWNPAP